MNLAQPIPGHYSTRVAAAVSGLSVPMIDYLCRSGTLVPSGDAPRGRGRPRAYTYEDLITLRAVAHLLAGNISVFRVRRALKKLQEVGRRPSGATYLASNGKTILYCSPDELWRELQSGQFVFRFVVEMKKVTDHVSEQLKNAKWKLGVKGRSAS